MPQEAEFFNAASADSTSTKTADSRGRSGSTSSARYRVSSRPVSTDVADTSSRSPELRLTAANMSTLLKRMSKNSTSTETSEPKNARYTLAIEAISPPKGSGTGAPKLPQKLRQHVSRLRSQFALGANVASSRTLTLNERGPSAGSPHKVPRLSVSSASINSKRFSMATVAMQHSRRSNQFHLLQATKEDEKPAESVAEASKGPQEPELTVANPGTFHDLLRPLQTSLSCASFNTGWSSDEEDEAEQLFRQSERENSRMLRVCCSIDNLMLSIGDQAQEQKQPEAIIRGATRDLVKLFQFAMKQVISVVFGDHPSNNNSPRGVKVDGKEAQYAKEFLLEINERIGKLYEFARCVFVNEVDGLRQQMQALEEDLVAVRLKNEQLQTEMRDLRDFYEHNNANSVDSFAADSSDSRRQILENSSDDPAISALSFPELPEVSSDAGEESNALKQQCQELSRLLELAKQEIRLSHHERDVQKARVAEVSSALFHDSELGMLRNQLQSEKKRVRALERENLTLREEQVTKLQALETFQASLGSTATADSTSNGPSIGRHSRPSIDSANSTVAAQQVDPVLSDSPEESTIPASELTIETQENQYNFTNSGIAPPGTLQDGVVTWFSRIVNPPPVTNIRKSRKKQTDPKPEQPSVVELSKFITSLLMTDKQLVAAKEESKARRQGNVPTLNPPMRELTARSSEGSGSRKSTSKKRRPYSAAASSAPGNSSLVNSTEVEESNEEIVAGCLQLAWAFYQRFLVAVEARNLLGNHGIGGDPTLGAALNSGAGSPVTEPVSLSVIVFHFFLERCSRELDAVHELEQFVRCLHSVRHANYNLELFCQFLEESCSRQELCFFLWVCQAMDDTRLGIPYDEPLSSNNEGIDNQQTQYICVLKATFLARTIFRLLHFKVLCRPMTAKKSKRRGKANVKGNSNSVAGPAIAPNSAANSPKRKHRTRLGELSAVLLVSQAENATSSTIDMADTGQVEQQVIPPHVAAQVALRDIIENNQGEPISLEAFNNLLLQFAVIPSPEELVARLGPFYQPTGEERKIPTDVFLALLMETYKFQLQWERDQLRALFIHLNHQEEIQQRASEKLVKVEDKKGRSKAGEENKKRSKVKLKRGKSRHAATDRNGESKYLHGLSRNVLRELLVQSGIVQDSDVAQMDMDWLYAEFLKRAGGVAADITFDGLFDALQKMRWLDSTKLRVDALMEVTGVLPTKRLQSGGSLRTKTRASFLTNPSSMVHAIREKWRVCARHSLALCTNDPNAFIRRHTQRLLHYVDQELARLVSRSESDAAVHCIREFLAFAWRVAAKRSRHGTAVLRQTCLSEIFLVSQALRPCIDSMQGYDGQVTLEDKPATDDNPTNATIAMKDALHSFYDTSRMNLNSMAPTNEQLHEVEIVLTLYAAHIEHLFHRFSEARYNGLPQVPFHRWRSMMYELDLVHPRNLPLIRLQALFKSVVKASVSTTEISLDQEIGVGKTQFSELFVLIAIERHRAALARKRMKTTTIMKPPDDNKEVLLEAELADSPGRIMAQFCRKVLAPRAFASVNALVERNFAAKLSCPLVGRALLEHRSFLRTIFFFYAKQDEVAEDERAALEEQALIRQLQENGGKVNENAQAKESESVAVEVNASLLQTDPGADFQLEKTKRSSMSFGEFQTFLTAFDLLDASEASCGNKVALADAQHVFSSVMALDNDDTLQLEFDEFAAAIVALAVHLDPSPFTLWHQKLDRFATKLRRVWTQIEELP